jgi:hypothetical protein
MGIFKKNNSCKKFFTYNTRTLDIKGLSFNVNSGFDFGMGQILIKPEYVEATEKLQELDLLQYSICNNINQLDEKDAFGPILLKKLIETQIEMMRIAQNAASQSTDKDKLSDNEIDTLEDIEKSFEDGNMRAVLISLKANLRENKNIILFISQYNDIDELMKNGILTKLSPDYKEYVARLRSFINDLSKKDFKK